jgi:hypothetical protein
MTATVFLDGLVLVAGDTDGKALASAGLFDLSSRQWSATGSLHAGRSNHAGSASKARTTVAPDGSTVIAALRTPRW